MTVTTDSTAFAVTKVQPDIKVDEKTKIETSTKNNEVSEELANNKNSKNIEKEKLEADKEALLLELEKLQAPPTKKEDKKASIAFWGSTISMLIGVMSLGQFTKNRAIPPILTGLGLTTFLTTALIANKRRKTDEAKLAEIMAKIAAIDEKLNEINNSSTLAQVA